MKSTKVLRKLLDNWKEKMIIAPGVHDPLCARIVEKLDFDVVYMGGAATSLGMLGLADFGLATATENQSNARNIMDVTSLPLIVDADNGYGNALNAMRTVRGYIRAGVAGLHIEDQVLPKRCGHLKGKKVIPLDEMVGKIEAVKKVIGEEDPDFVLIADRRKGGSRRRGSGGGDQEAQSDYKAGADMVFADGLLSKEELERVGRETGGPSVFHPTAISPRLC